MVSKVSRPGTIWAKVTLELQKTDSNVTDTEIANATQEVMKDNGISDAQSRKMTYDDIAAVKMDAITPKSTSTKPASGTGSTAAPVVPTSPIGQNNNDFLSMLFSSGIGGDAVNTLSGYLNGLFIPPVSPDFFGNSMTMDSIAGMRAPLNFRSAVQTGDLMGGVVNNLGGRDIMAQRGFFV